ncbi:MAG: aspartate aminotransferase, partial [Planctomycetaceae bacterium]
MDRWIADRMQRIDASGIRKVFDLAAKLKDPINLSIGQPHYDTPEPIKQALYRAV